MYLKHLKRKYLLVVVVCCFVGYLFLQLTQWTVTLNNVVSCTHIEPKDIPKPITAPTDPFDCRRVSSNIRKGINICLLHYEVPQCSNVAQNMIKGKWVEKQYPQIQEDKKKLDDMLTRFRTYHEGFSAPLFRKDDLCGFKHMVKPNWCLDNLPPQSLRSIDASSWCDPKSDKPCCSHDFDGTCLPESQCIGPKSVNLAKFTHAEVSEWVPSNIDCKMVLYNQNTACSLLHDKKVRTIGFIGNSFVRNMYSVMLQMLQNNFYNGTIKTCVPGSLRKRCVNQFQNLDKFCLNDALAINNRVLPGNGLCEGFGDLLLFLKSFYLAEHGTDLKKQIQDLLDKPGTYLVVGIGTHDAHNARLVKEKYLKPSFDVLKGHMWPKFIWIHPLMTGIYKPPMFVALHGTDEKVDEFIKEIEMFCKAHKVPTFDFRELTTGVWSAEGTHYGTRVNFMKLQIILNFLASNEAF